MLRFSVNRRLTLLPAAVFLLSGCLVAPGKAGPADSADIESHFYCSPEKAKAFSDISEIRNLPFEPFTNKVSFGYINKPCYFKINIGEIKESGRILLDTENAHYNHITFWHEQNGEMIRTVQTGDMLPFTERDYIARTFVFRADLKKNSANVLYFAVDTDSSLNFSAAVYSESAYISHMFKEAVLLSLFSGAILIMIVYNFVLFIILRDKTYLYYSLSVLSNFILQIELVGTAFQVVWPNWPGFHQISMAVQVGISALFGFLFARGFLRTKIRLPVMNKLLLWSAVVSGILIVFYFFIPIILSSQMANLHAQAFVIIMMIAGIRGIFKRVREARFFVIAWFFLITGIMLFSLADVGVLPSNPFTRLSNLLGSVLEAALLSIALADRIQAMRREKEEAQHQSLEAQRILNEELESRIAERTSELSGALGHIQKDLGLARKIQTNLLPDISAEPYNEFIEIFFAPADQVGGDIYDIFTHEPGKIRIMVSDATGHGVQGALMSMALRSEYESLKAIIDDPGQLLQRLNSRIARKFQHLTAIYPVIVCDIDFQTGMLQYASAGHPPVICMKQDGLQLLDRTGPILGFRENIEYTTGSINLNANDQLLIFSDAIFEETNSEGEDFGLDRIEETVKKWQSDQAGSLIDRILLEVGNFTGNEELSDDCTMIHIRLPDRHKVLV